MSTNEQVIRRWFDEFNQGKEQAVAVLDETLTVDYVQHDPETPVEGKEAMRQFVSTLYDAFPDLRMTLEEIFSAGDRVVYRALLSGTHRGEFLGIPPTGKPFQSPLISVARMVDGKVSDEWQVWDLFGMLRQIGAVGSETVTETHKATVRRWMEALNEGDLDAFDSLATSDYVYHGSGVELQGVSELKAFLREVHAAFSDLHFTTERMVFEGDLGAMQFTMHGHQRLPFFGIPSRGNRLDLSFQVISRFRDGKIAEDWEVFDAAEMRRQLETPAVSAV